MKELLKKRLLLVQKTSSQKNKVEKNKLGQFATPASIANEIVAYALNQIKSKDIRYLEPGFGTGSFYNSILTYVNKHKKHTLSFAKGFEVDPLFYTEAQKLYNTTPLELELEDFTTASPQPHNLILCNPPYVRHQHLNSDKKVALAKEVNKRYNLKLSGYTGLYNYFMILGESWLSSDGISAWLVPSEFLDVKYGVQVKKFLLNQVTLTRIHLYASEELQFDDALVSSAIIFYKKGAPSQVSTLEISYGGSLLNPTFTEVLTISTLDEEKKWTRLIKEKVFKKTNNTEKIKDAPKITIKDLFDIKRGVATGNNSFFILSEERVNELNLSTDMFLPVLPSSRHLKTDMVESDKYGTPVNINKLFLLNCRESEVVIKEKYPSIWTYIASGIGTVDQTYLCKNRKVWYYQETRLPAPILCTYMGRNEKRPFRFILNKSNAIATNSYLMLYPNAALNKILKNRPELITDIWDILSKITSEDLISEGRTYGGGLEKLEPSELGKVSIPDLADLLIQ